MHTKFSFYKNFTVETTLYPNFLPPRRFLRNLTEEIEEIVDSHKISFWKEKKISSRLLSAGDQSSNRTYYLFVN